LNTSEEIEAAVKRALSYESSFGDVIQTKEVPVGV